ncbi:hypothetical protein RSAG8_13352, partial [Rhizoctonia solani AG-8 WAC10335]
MNTIPFTTTEPSTPTTPHTPSYSEALRYLAQVAAAQEWTDALGAMHGSLPKHIPARRRRHSRKASRVAGPPGLPTEIKELVVLETKRVTVKIPDTPIAGPSSSTTPKPSLKLVPWTYPPIDEDAIAPPSPIEGPSLESDSYSSYDSEFDTELDTETDTELETEFESDVVPRINRPKVRVVIDDSEPNTPEFEAECEPWPLVIPTPTTAKSVDIRPDVELGKLVDQVFAEEEENDDDEWIYGPPSYYTSPPESPNGMPAPTPMYTDDEYESEIELEQSFDLMTDAVATHHLRNDLEIIRPFSPDAPEIMFTPPTWEAFFECMPPQDEAYGQLLALPGSTPLGPAELGRWL